MRSESGTTAHAETYRVAASHTVHVPGPFFAEGAALRDRRLRGAVALHLQPARGARNPVLTCDDVVDAAAAFVADPFMLRTELGWCMFFEVLNRVSWKGEIALATSRTGIRWRYCQIVLRETFHLSYPYVFRAGETYYMIPESYPDNSVRLYKADEFPTRWSFVAKLLDGRDWVDASIFRFGQHWWLFACLGAPPLRADTQSGGDCNDCYRCIIN